MGLLNAREMDVSRVAMSCLDRRTNGYSSPRPVARVAAWLCHAATANGSSTQPHFDTRDGEQGPCLVAANILMDWSAENPLLLFLSL